MPLRVLLSPDGMWLAAKDIYAAHGLKNNRAYLSYFDPAHLQLLTFESDQGPVRLTAVSPLGIATIALSLNLPQDRILDSWIRKTTRQLAEEFGFAPLEWTLLADGRVPKKPRSWDAQNNWYPVKMQNHRDDRRAANLHEPALFDEDPDLPPHDPLADTPAYRRARGEYVQRTVGSYIPGYGITAEGREGLPGVRFPDGLAATAVEA